MTVIDANLQSDQTEDHFSRLTHYYVLCEKTLNFAGYIPGVTETSGKLRMMLGALQLIEAVVTIPLTCIVNLFIRQSQSASITLKHEYSHIVNGCGNIVRGFVEINSYTIHYLFLFLYDYIFYERLYHSIELKPGYTDLYIRAWKRITMQS